MGCVHCCTEFHWAVQAALLPKFSREHRTSLLCFPGLGGGSAVTRADCLRRWLALCVWSRLLPCSGSWAVPHCPLCLSVLLIFPHRPLGKPGPSSPLMKNSLLSRPMNNLDNPGIHKSFRSCLGYLLKRHCMQSPQRRVWLINRISIMLTSLEK